MHLYGILFTLLISTPFVSLSLDALDMISYDVSKNEKIKLISVLVYFLSSTTQSFILSLLFKIPDYSNIYMCDHKCIEFF